MNANTQRLVDYATIVDKISQLCLEAAFNLPADVYASLEKSKQQEVSSLGQFCIAQCLNNAAVAKCKQIAICQDTGVAVYFVEFGEDVKVVGGDIYSAIQEGTRRGYQAGYLRKSIARDPVFDRSNTKDNTPAIIHLDLVPGDKISIVLAPKGGGSENMSAMKMLKPLQGKTGIIDFVVDTIKNAGGNPCPPVVIGLGIGGNFELVTYLAKKALLRKLGTQHPDPNYAAFEAEILEKVNATGIGPEGLGGRITALAVHILTHPCHIASLPVAVNLNCHAARHADVVI